MKQQLIKLRNRIDALSLRERVMLFAAAAGSIVFLVFLAWLDPLYAKQRTLRAQIAQAQDNINGIDAEIGKKMETFAADPDEANRLRLKAIHDEVAKLGGDLRAAQNGLVAPDKMVPLLETILKGNNRLRLVSLKTLPVAGVSEASADLPKDAATDGKDSTGVQHLMRAAGVGAEGRPTAPNDPKTGAAPLKAPELLYRHGVEITLQGSYLDMVAYMTELETMPVQLFWGKAKLEAQEYPKARLTLTLYTLSLDQKWMKL
jgi:MSHA biogenesis protein MshJ